MPGRIDSPFAPSVSQIDIIDKFPKPPSSTQPQTFLYSPSEDSFRMDSPVLPRFERQPSDTPSCNSIIEGAYPSPLHQRTFLHSPSESSFRSSYTRWGSCFTAVEGPSPLLTTHRISDWLPDDTDFYAEDDAYLAEWNVSPPNEQVETEIEPLVIKDELPVIGERDFPYYPAPAALSFTKPVKMEREGDLKIMRRRLERKVGAKVFSFREFARNVWKKIQLRTFS